MWKLFWLNGDGCLISSQWGQFLEGFHLRSFLANSTGSTATVDQEILKVKVKFWILRDEIFNTSKIKSHKIKIENILNKIRLILLTPVRFFFDQCCFYIKRADLSLVAKQRCSTCPHWKYFSKGSADRKGLDSLCEGKIKLKLSHKVIYKYKLIFSPMSR